MKGVTLFFIGIHNQQMASETTNPHYLAQRANWQAQANAEGAAHENRVEDIFKAYFATEEGAGFEYIKHPHMLDQCFLEYQYRQNPSKFIKPETPQKDQIYYDTVLKRFRKWTGKSWTDAKEGMIPDGQIRCLSTGLSILIEDKKQNDSGNAHERACRYAAPKVVKFIQEKLGLSAEQQPIAWIFSGKIATNQKYIDEIEFCFPQGYTIMLSPSDDKKKLIDWFNAHIRPILQ
jgi:hypothetical protein